MTPYSQGDPSQIISDMVPNWPFPSSLLPPCQNESKCETIHMTMRSAYRFIFMQIKLIFIWIDSHLDSFWNRGTRELGNGLLFRGCHYSRAPLARVACHVNKTRVTGLPVSRPYLDFRNRGVISWFILYWFVLTMWKRQTHFRSGFQDIPHNQS